MKNIFKYLFIIIFLNIFYIQVSFSEDLLNKKIITFEEILEQPDNLQLNLLYAKQQEKIEKFKNVIATLERLHLLYPSNYDIKLYYCQY